MKLISLDGSQKTFELYSFNWSVLGFPKIIRINDLIPWQFVQYFTTVHPTVIKTDHLPNWNWHESHTASVVKSFFLNSFNVERSLSNGKMTMGYVKFIITFVTQNINTAYIHNILYVYNWLSLGPSMTPHMVLIWSGVCSLASVECWMPHNQRLAKSLGFTSTNSRPLGFGSPVIVVCGHCWALPCFLPCPSGHCCRAVPKL